MRKSEGGKDARQVELCREALGGVGVSLSCNFSLILCPSIPEFYSNVRTNSSIFQLGETKSLSYVKCNRT